MQEKWKPITGFEGIYEISNKGRVLSLARLDTKGRRVKQKFLTPWLNKNQNRYCFTLLNKGKQYSKTRYRLLAREFIPSFREDLQVDHIDGDSTNDSIVNLRMVTGKQNCRASAKLRRKSSQFRGVYNRKDTGKWVAQIRSKTGNKREALGSFNSEREAALAWNKRAIENGYMPEALNDVAAFCPCYQTRISK